jgi:hypothetical protein
VFLHLGEEQLVLSKDIIGIFDYNLVKKSRDTKEFIEIVTDEMVIEKISKNKEIKSFIITKDKVFLSPISSLTLQKRASDVSYQNN